MTPFDKFKETAALVNLWITEEKPKIERFGCRNCQYAHSMHESFDRFFYKPIWSLQLFAKLVHSDSSH